MDLNKKALYTIYLIVYNAFLLVIVPAQ